MAHRTSLEEIDKSFVAYDYILIDGLNLMSIQYYAKAVLSYEGTKTGMLFGVTSVLLKLMARWPKTQIIFLWEGFNSIRKSLDPNYKANRVKKEDQFSLSIKDTTKAINYLGITQMVHQGLEADDLAGWFVSEHKKSNILLVSNDRDWWQFLRSDTEKKSRVDACIKNEIFTYETAESALGYPPSSIWLFKSLTGDQSDNIVGIRSIPHDLCAQICRKVHHDVGLVDLHSFSYEKKYLHWKKTIEESWPLIEQNSRLIKFHPEWINSKALSTITPKQDKAALLQLLADRGIMSLNEKVVSQMGKKNESNEKKKR